MLKDKNFEQLFNELTPEETQNIKGGLCRVKFDYLRAVKAGADFGWGNDDDTYMKVAGKVFMGEGDFATGDTAVLNRKPYEFGDQGLLIELWDADGGLAGGDDLIGRKTLTCSTSSPLRFSGSGSKYDLYFGIQQATVTWT